MEHARRRKTKKKQTFKGGSMKIQIHDRTHLDYPGKNLVIELVEFPLSDPEEREDHWRLIDLLTGEVFSKSIILHDVIHDASAMTESLIDNPVGYIEERLKTYEQTFQVVIRHKSTGSCFESIQTRHFRSDRDHFEQVSKTMSELEEDFKSQDYEVITIHSRTKETTNVQYSC